MSKAHAKLFAFAFACQQQTLWLYHMNSYANQPVMLRSSKPLLMRDVFLTKATAPFANPMSTLYVPYTWDMFWNCTAAWLFGMSIVPVVGFMHLSACFFAGGFVSGLAYLFQAQLNPSRLRTEHDCNASSNGGWCAVSALALTLKPERRARMPFIFSRMPVGYVGAAYIVQALLGEYFPPFRDWRPKLLLQSSSATGRDAELKRYHEMDVQPRLSNWGCIGGVFFGLVYGTLVVRLRADRRSVSGVYESIRRQTRQ